MVVILIVMHLHLFLLINHLIIIVNLNQYIFYSSIIQFSYRTNSNPRDNGIHYIQYRRYGLKHNIEVLVFWENGSYYNAQWIPQTKLKGNGSKECDNYLARQYLYSPLWKYVLNIAEVSLSIHSFIYRNNYSINSFHLLS